MSDPTAQDGSLEAKGSDAALQFQRGLVRHRHRQRRRCLQTIGSPRDRLRYCIVGASCETDAFQPQIVQRRRGQRQNLNVEPGLVHQGDASVGKIKQTPFELS
ncbi:Hypothetical protein RG1141_PA11060 (plasmid) [Neorhizobium galegae bv. officinalis bv. officinalis str. HAMBI 1141]|uniref:Uncharacterized protein n=1 Tax=Neorhizobium galegae bv. officinalis bv. officinalis str. HAMBI 1141 TaxID=1028801 RepID=A0A068THY4_NEOGA|nr:Hypothetical protein RG1141_PA11060 [Neorhizobium galegae bv. officinalis bv. officinalis str. HAMBI 1141]